MGFRKRRAGRSLARMKWPLTHRRISALIGFEALTLAVAAVIHLTGAGSEPKATRAGAGIAEAIICVVLAFGAFSLLSELPWGRAAALGSTVFAIFGFVLGLTFTLRGGDGPDVAYHGTMLPILLFTAIALLRACNGPHVGRGALPTMPSVTRSYASGSRSAPRRPPSCWRC